MRVKAYILSGILLSISPIAYSQDLKNGGSFPFPPFPPIPLPKPDVTVNGNGDTNGGSQFGTITFQGNPTIFGDPNKSLILTTSDKVTIHKITNPAGKLGKGFSAELKADNASEVVIENIHHQNYTGGSWIHVNVKNKLVVGNIRFGTDGIAGSQGHVELKSTDGDVIVKDVSGCDWGCTGGLGIRPLNFLKIDGKNFYGGKIEAIGLPAVGSNSTLDLSGVKNTTFIDDLYMRSGTLYAKDFHFNNLTIWKGHTNRLDGGHPTAGSAYTAIDKNIGKSFINNLSMEIGTSPTDSASLWFRQGGEILNINSVSYTHLTLPTTQLKCRSRWSPYH